MPACLLEEARGIEAELSAQVVARLSEPAVWPPESARVDSSVTISPVVGNFCAGARVWNSQLGYELVVLLSIAS